MSTVSLLKVTDRQIAIVAFNAALTYKDGMSDCQFRKAVLATLRTVGSESSAPINYNHAMDIAISDKICLPFGKKHGVPGGTRAPLDATQEKEIVGAMSSAIAIVTGNEEIAIKASMTWKVYNKKSTKIVHYATSKKHAYALRNGDTELSCKSVV